MSHSESAIAGFYDHEQQSTRGEDRRREAPDWGGDDLFTSTPRRRRFDHAGRGEGHAARRRDTIEHPLPPRRVSGPQAPKLDLGIVADVLAPEPAAAAPRTVVPLADGAAFAALDPEPEVAGHIAMAEPPASGRKTVTITGHPDPMPVRRRPAPTMDERLIGTRPERIASYAFAMGLLLILIAFLTAQ